MAEQHPQGTDHPLRRRYTDEALRYLPRLFQMIDRNPYSPTYGSFDRSYWHYRTMDFPCGMYQEFCLPLALAHAHPFPGNPYHGVARVRELALAGVDFARRSSREDGTCDDYFPYERALGAMVFSLYACSEAVLVLEEPRIEFLEFFRSRADWLCSHNETGQLTNHQALAALALHNVYLLIGDKKYEAASNTFVDIVRKWQSPEGWFQEYEGADPGYHTCTIAFLAKLYRKNNDPALLDIMQPAVDFAWHFMHPDGSYGGEYGSRNTYHFYPHGFEVMAPLNARAAQIADCFLEKSLPDATRYFNDDDRMCAHYLYDWMHAHLDFSPVRAVAPIWKREPVRKWWPGCRMAVEVTPSYHAVVSLLKGGVIKVFADNGPVYSDTGLIGRTAGNKVVVSHIVDEYKVEADETAGRYRVTGWLCERRSKLPTPFKQVLFRILNMTLGRLNPNLLRSVLQKVLITGKSRTAYEFTREFEFLPDSIVIRTTLTRRRDAEQFVSLHYGSDATSIYVANSNVYQESVLLPWREANALLAEVNSAGAGTHTLTVTPSRARAAGEDTASD